MQGIRRIEGAAERRSAGELVVGGTGLLLGVWGGGARDARDRRAAVRRRLPAASLFLGSAPSGIGYLDDGTMIVIEGGRTRLGDTGQVEVTSVLQSASGKMIFSRVAWALVRCRRPPL